jgi:hypothetical protein
VITVMGMHKLTAGSGYDYLTRQVARNDSARPASTPLADYYDEKGEAPGVWLGSGLGGIDGLDVGDMVTAAQMDSLFGKGLHPLAAARLVALGADATAQQRRDAVRLGRPYREPDTSTSLFRHELGRRYATWNKAHDIKPTAKLPDEVRAKLRTELATEGFIAMEHRAPNPRELSGFIARMSRPPATPVSGYDLTFSPVKSVSSLWAIADRQTAALIEAAHWAAVTDALRFIESEVLKSRKGRAGVEQVDVRGLVAAAFTHRDNRASDPDLHTHVAVANKVQAVVDGQWRAIDGRAMHKAITAASETYNTALEAHLNAVLGLRFVDIPARTDGGPSASSTASTADSSSCGRRGARRSLVAPGNWRAPSRTNTVDRRRPQNTRSFTKWRPSRSGRPSTNLDHATSSAQPGTPKPLACWVSAESTGCFAR